MKQSVWTNSSKPQAFITQRKQRVKQHKSTQLLLDSIIYLSDGDNYEIELFNPKSVHILAKITIDKQQLPGGGIVLRPGERVFLERFLDSNNKFVFRTYEVGKEAINVGATENNGFVQIDFYTEQIPSPTYWSGNQNTLNLNGNITYTTLPNTFTTNTLGISGITNTAYYSSNTGTLTSGINSVVSPTSNTFEGPNIRNAKKVETGTTEKGELSSQQFTQSYKNFNMHSCEAVVYQILPNSQKQYHKEDLGVLYCGECGAKRKKDTHKFCPHCGTKF
jgi:hypothetical protein